MRSELPVSANTSQTVSENRAFYPALDGLRTLAFLLVFLMHYILLPWGWAGVNLFFVLSGFLITGILYDTQDAPNRARNFYLRRTLRIFPLYYAVLLCLLLATPLLHGFRSWRWALWAAYLGNFLRMLPPGPPGSLARHLGDFQPVMRWRGEPVTLYLGHFWSLCIEEQFYLLWPWIVFSVRDRRKLLWICGLSLPVGLALRLASQALLPAWMITQDVLQRCTPLCCDALLFGGLLALLFRSQAKAHMLTFARWSLGPSLLLFAGLLWSQRQFDGRGRYLNPHWTETFGFTAVDMLGALLLLTALQPDTLLYKLLNLRPLRWAGRLSYGAYIFHDIPHELLQRFSLHFVSHERRALLGMALVFTYIAAWLSFRFLETPFLNLKDRYTVRSHPAPVVLPAKPQSSYA